MVATRMPPDAAGGGLTERVAFVLAAWRSITRREWLLALGIGVGSALVGVLMAIEVLIKPEQGIPALVHSSLWLMVICIVGLLTWAVADRASGDGNEPARLRRMAAALLVTALLGPFVLPLAVYRGLGVELPIVKLGERERKLPPLWVALIRGTVETLVFGGLAFGLIEAQRRRRLAAAALTGLQHGREELARRALEARLAAMQAQVEPRFLFDSLVDIDALYQRDGAQAAAMLDRLITYLRVALPQLRERGSRAQAEADLVAAYLQVVAGRHGGLPRTQVVVEPDAADARFYPMLLLPLVQRAVRAADADPARLPAAVQLVMKRQGAQLVALLRIEARGQCENDAELEQLRERLAALYGGTAVLACAESQRGLGEFSLRIPYEPFQRTDGGRR